LTRASCRARRSTCSAPSRCPGPPVLAARRRRRDARTSRERRCPARPSRRSPPRSTVCGAASRCRGGRLRARLLMGLPAKVRLVEWVRATDSRTRRDGAGRREVALNRSSHRRRDAGDRGDVVRVAQVGAQMADAAEVMARIRRRSGVRYPVLTPNLKGFEVARRRCDEVAVFVAASKPSRRRTSTAASPRAWSGCARCSTRRRRTASAVRGYVSCVLGCPTKARSIRAR